MKLKRIFQVTINIDNNLAIFSRRKLVIFWNYCIYRFAVIFGRIWRSCNTSKYSLIQGMVEGGGGRAGVHRIEGCGQLQFTAPITASTDLFQASCYHCLPFRWSADVTLFDALISLTHSHTLPFPRPAFLVSTCCVTL